MNDMLFAHKRNRVLVVGTTSDYIDWIRTARPGEALFLTDPDIRKQAREACPDSDEEILCPIPDARAAWKALRMHLDTREERVIGVACFDCESMETAAHLAQGLGLPYPDLRAIRNCRDKFISKQLWQENRIPCPATQPVGDKETVFHFLDSMPAGLVLKPFCGSGSELVFKCKTRHDCETAFNDVASGLVKRAGNPLFKRNASGPYLMLAEEWVPGPEFSCDFVLDKDRAVILRKTRKLKMKRPFGTISGYAICLDSEGDTARLADLFYRAAHALGIRCGICMVDFILRDGEPVLIEMTPRPGGDCLPFLLKEAGNLDILALALDVAAGRPLGPAAGTRFKPHVGFRIHARKGGVIRDINTQGLNNDRRLKHLHLIRTPGHVVAMPPADYDSWLLGHMILEPDNATYPETECLLISKRIDIEMDETC